MIKPLAVISAPVDTYSGYGARSRDFIKAVYEIKKDEWDIKVIPQRWGNTPWGFLDSHKESWGWIKNLYIQQLTQQPDFWCQVTVPNEAQPIGKYNVLLTAGIETTICDPSWIDGCNRMNITLVSSEHAKKVFQESVFNEQNKNTGQITRTIKLERPIDVLFEGIDLTKYHYVDNKDMSQTDLVTTLNEIPESFCFLFVGHWLQGDIGEDRKNLGLTIKTFLETFKDQTKKPALILKTAKGTNSIMDRDEILEKIDVIRKTVKAKDLPNIYLLHGELDDDDMNNLYNHFKVKAMLYLTKGEGFGRPLAEYYMSKKPALVSAWSGHMDFCNPEYAVFVPGELTDIHPSAQVQNMLIQGSKWFTANMKYSADKMKDMFENYSKYVDNAKRQSYFVKTNFSFDSMKSKLVTYLDAVPKPIALKLPTLKKIELPSLSKKVE
jgi:glycosyltransferase involved in cell wall biosynthesis